MQMIDIIVDRVDPTNRHSSVWLVVELRIWDVLLEIDLETEISYYFQRIYQFLSNERYLIHLNKFSYDEYH